MSYSTKMNLIICPSSINSGIASTYLNPINQFSPRMPDCE